LIIWNIFFGEMFLIACFVDYYQFQDLTFYGSKKSLIDIYLTPIIFGCLQNFVSLTIINYD